MYTNSLNAYQTVEKTTATGRETEARVLTKAALKLKYCRDNWRAADRRQKLDEALTYTQRVWSLIQGDLLEENNPLPLSIRKNILILSAYIDKRIFDIIQKISNQRPYSHINLYIFISFF